MLKCTLVVALSLLTVPFLAAPAAADPLEDPSAGSVEVGPCTVSWSFIWPGDHVTLRCAEGDTELLFAKVKGQEIGNCVEVRAAGTGTSSCGGLPLATPMHDGDATYEAGPCTVHWSIYWPGENLGIRCTAAGQEVLTVSYGTGYLGSCLTVGTAGGVGTTQCT